jgi:hypothetical protein
MWTFRPHGIGAAALLLALAGGVPEVRAGDPPLPCSDVPACIRLAPDGALPVEGVLRDGACQVLPGHAVRLVIGAACPAVRVCPDATVPPPVVLETTTETDGSFRFHPAAGGCCSAPGAIIIEADPGAVAIAVYDEIGSPDSGGDGNTPADLTVTLPDFARFSHAFLTVSPCFDYTVTNPAALDHCDGEVALADFAYFAQAFLSACP